MVRIRMVYNVIASVKFPCEQKTFHASTTIEEKYTASQFILTARIQANLLTVPPNPL